MLKFTHIGESTATVVSWLLDLVEVGAVGLRRGAADAVDRRSDRAVGQVELRVHELGLRRRRREAAALWKFPVASSRSFCDSASCSTSGLVRARFAFAISSAACSLRARLGLIELRLERLLVHQEQHLPLLHHRAFGVDAPVEKAADPRLDVDLARALRLRDELEHRRRVARCDRDHRDLDRRLGGGCGLPCRRQRRARCLAPRRGEARDVRTDRTPSIANSLKARAACSHRGRSRSAPTIG